jgi:hypothetical protein
MERFYGQKQPPVPMTDARRRMALFPKITPPHGYVYYASAAPTSDMATREQSTALPNRNETPQDVSDTPLHPSTVWTPVVVVKNVYILPGIPSLYQTLLTSLFHHHLAPTLRNDNQNPLVRQRWGTAWAEGDLAPFLTQAQDAFKGRVAIGSYPRWRGQLGGVSDDADTKDTAKVWITFEGENGADVEACAQSVGRNVPITRLPNVDVSQ